MDHFGCYYTPHVASRNHFTDLSSCSLFMHPVSALQQWLFPSLLLVEGLIQDLLRPMKSLSFIFLCFGPGPQLTAGKITSIPRLLNHHFDNYDNVFVIFKASDFHEL